METTIIVLVIGFATAVLIRSVMRNLKEGTPACGCAGKSGGCGLAGSCGKSHPSGKERHDHSRAS